MKTKTLSQNDLKEISAIRLLSISEILDSGFADLFGSAVPQNQLFRSVSRRSSERAYGDPAPMTESIYDGSVASGTPAGDLVDGLHLVDARELARILGVKIGTVYYWSSRGEIPKAIGTGRILRFDPGAVKAELAKRASKKSRNCTIKKLVVHSDCVSGSLKRKDAGRASKRKEVKHGN